MDPRTHQVINEIEGKVESLVKLLGHIHAGATVKFDRQKILTGQPTIPEANAASDQSLLTMLEVIARMSSCLQEGKLYPQIVQGALDITDSQRGFLMVMEDGSKLRWKNGIGINQASLMSGKEGSRSIIKDVVKGGQAVLRGSMGQPGTKSMFGNSIDSVICIPIPIGKRLKKSNSKNNVAGILYVDSKDMAGDLNQGSLDLLNSYSKHVSVAIENAWLYAKNSGF
jgi:hypothetical protein